MKYLICKSVPHAVYESLECLGGNGYTEDLPMASWEGAAHRPWALVAAGALAVAALAIVLFIVAGTTPLGVLSSEMSRLEMMRDILRLTSTAVRNAPTTWQITIGVLFVIVNTILVLLLRRAPRGIDA